MSAYRPLAIQIDQLILRACIQMQMLPCLTLSSSFGVRFILLVDGFHRISTSTFGARGYYARDGHEQTVRLVQRHVISTPDGAHTTLNPPLDIGRCRQDVNVDRSFAVWYT
jgi:hypothetical protein